VKFRGALARASYKDERKRNSADKRKPWREWRRLPVNSGLDERTIAEEPLYGRYETPISDSRNVLIRGPLERLASIASAVASGRYDSGEPEGCQTRSSSRQKRTK